MAANVLQSNITPTVSSVLSPLQLALAGYMFQGTVPPFFVNQEFLAAVKEFADTNCLSLMTTDYVTGQPKPPDVNPNYTGNAFVSLNDDIYIQEQNPNLSGYSFTFIGTRSQIAPGSYSYNGGSIVNGTAARGSGDWDAVYGNISLLPEE